MELIRLLFAKALGRLAAAGEVPGRGSCRFTAGRGKIMSIQSEIWEHCRKRTPASCQGESFDQRHSRQRHCGLGFRQISIYPSVLHSENSIYVHLMK